MPCRPPPAPGLLARTGGEDHRLDGDLHPRSGSATSGATIARMDDYLAVNRANWDERAAVHAASAEYGFGRFAADPAHLSDVVRFDRPLLGDVAGLTGIHLQCHIGTDTLSLARLGARMTGLDLSPVSLEQARRLAADAGSGADVDYVEADTYSAVEAVGGRTFDLVYTGHRRPVLAARHRPVGRCRRRPPRAGWAVVRARGASDDVGRRRDPYRRSHPRLRRTSRPPSRSTSRRTAPTSRTTTSSSTPASCRGTTASARR